MGVRASNTGWINMDDVRVPATHRLGEEGEGFKIAMSALDNARYGVAAGAVGIVKACLEESIAYGQPAQNVRQTHRRVPVVQADAGPHAAEYRHRATAGLEGGLAEEPGHPQHARDEHGQVVLHRGGRRAADDAVQIHGAYGYSDEYNVERHLRNTKSAVIYEGPRRFTR